KERVLAHPEEVNQKGFLGRNAIHLCAFYGHAELIPLILGMVSNADAHLKDELGLTAAELVPHHLSLIPALSSADAAHVKIVTPKIPKSATPPLVKKLAAWESDDQSLRDSELATYLSNLTLTDNEAHPGFKHDLRRLYLSQVIKEVNANRIQFIEAFLKEGYSIEELSEFVGENILAYCYHADLNFLFYLFYSFGGALGTQLTPKELQKRHQIFIVAQNSLL
ncbi:MAG: hypothetical protein JSR17_03095, partial [Proteobacteria bacterium]|nr:hypothetical protein [Pseudomonadota bacterium]